MSKIQFKRGLEKDIPILSIGEPGYTTDTHKLFVGSASGNIEIAKIDDLNTLQSSPVIPNSYAWVSTNGQDTFQIPNGKFYDVRLVSVAVGGVVQPNIALIDDKTFQLPEALTDGVNVYVEWYEVPVPITAGHHSSHEAGGADEIDITKLKNFDQIASVLQNTSSVTPNSYSWVSTDGQDTFQIPSGTFKDVRLMDVTVGGVTQTSITLIDDTTFQLPEALSAGIDVYVEWFETPPPVSTGHHSTHELGGQDEIDLTKLKNYSRITDIAVNVKDYGANGIDTNDTTNDDTFAIQNAFNLARDNGNVKLYFPEGVYCISNYIQVYKNTTVILHPNAVIKRIGTANKMFVNGQLGNATYVSGGLYTGEGNIHFYGGTFDMNCQVGSTSALPATTTTSFFDMLHAEDISFDHITVKNGQIGHYFQVSSCKNVRFKDCWFGAVNYTGTGGTDYNYECIQVEVATSTSNSDFGVYDLTISRDVYVENCVFDGTIRAFGNHSDAQYGTGSDILCENVNFINNRILNPIHSGLHLTGFKHSRFENNFILNAGTDAIQTLKIQDCIIEDNIILSPQKTGFYIDTSHNNKFLNNIIKDASQGGTYAGIRVTASNGNSFNSDTVYADTPKFSYAYYSDTSSGNKISNNKFTKGLTSTIGGDYYSMSANLAWVSIGDSITHGGNSDATFTSGVAQGYYQDHALPLMSKITTHYNRGYGGYTMAIPRAGDTYTGITSVDSQFEVADVYTIFLGTNDFSRNIPVGSYASATGAQNDFYGAMKQLYVDLTGKNMNAIIIFVTPMKRTLVSGGSTIAWDSANTAGYKLADYVNAIKDFCSNYGCPVLDLFNESGISNRTASTMLYDGLHPFLETNKRIGKMIANKINMYI
jgi:parallel beta-helix repeat protein